MIEPVTPSATIRRRIEFSDVDSSGRYHYGTVRTDDTLVRWNDDGEILDGVPTGTFKDVKIGSQNQEPYCAIRTDDTVACWGYNIFIDVTPPPGTFKSVSAINDTICGVSTDGRLRCWGGTARQPLD